MQVTYCARIKSILSKNAVHAMIICAFIDQEPLHEKPVPTLSICLSDAYYGQRIAAAHIQRIPIQRPEERISIWLRDSIGVKYVISYVKSFDSSSNAYGAHVNGISPTYCSAAFSTSKWLILRTNRKTRKVIAWWMKQSYTWLRGSFVLILIIVSIMSCFLCLCLELFYRCK